MQTTSTTSKEQDREEPGFGLPDLFESLLRHWRIILICGVAGMGAAVATFFLAPSTYQSQAKLLVRYLLERGGIDPEMKSQVQGTSYTASVINDEIEILTSWDLARKVAQAVGPERLVRKEPPSQEEAARLVKKGLEVGPVRESNVIRVAYRNPDATLAAEVLEKLIEAYFAMHLDIHRSAAASQFVAQETEQVRARLQEIDEELNKLRAEGGIFSIGDGVESVEPRRANSQAELLESQAERAGQLARIEALEAVLSGKTRTSNQGNGGEAASEKLPTEDDVADYALLVERLAQLRKRNADLSSKFTAESPLVRASLREIESLEAQRRELVMEFPSLITRAGKSEPGALAINLDDERARLAQIEGRISILQSHLTQIEEQEDRLPMILGKIRDLERMRETEEEKYRYFKASMENARIDGALDPSLMPNISVVQEASPPERAPLALLKKILFLLASGGFGAGLGIALIIDFVFDRRIKTPEAVQRRLGIPSMASIPFLGEDRSAGGAPAAGDDSEPSFRPHVEAIHGRLHCAFRDRKDDRRPVMLGVTSLGKGAGVSMLATNLARCFRQNGERVLFIDVASACSGPLPAHPMGLGDSGEEAGRSVARVLGHRAEEGVPEWETVFEASRGLTPSKLQELATGLRTGDLDAVVFDLPPMGTSAATYILSASLDQVLLVLDPATAEPELLKRSFEELSARHVHPLCIYNKLGMRPASAAHGKAQTHHWKAGLWNRLGQPLRTLIPVWR